MNITNSSYDSKLYTFYTEKQAVREGVGYSRSPMKPFLLMEKIGESRLSGSFSIQSGFSPFKNADFEVAHEKNYVQDYFAGKKPLAISNGLDWRKDFAKTVRYTNSSLYHAQKYAVENPACITFSPTSGFHHARPESGAAFCTFSGQVISAVKLYREKKIRTAWIDMDGHFGNSIEDSRSFVPDLDEAIPEGMNINPARTDRLTVLQVLKQKLKVLVEEVKKGNIGSICYAQGADSHTWDDLAFSNTSLGTADWVAAHRMVFETIRDLCITLKRPIPLTLSLFGGYRKSDYDSVLNLHFYHLQSCLDILCGVPPKYELKNATANQRILLKEIMK